MAKDPFDWLTQGGLETPQEVEGANAAVMQEAQEQIIKDARIYFRVFDTPDGRELLAMLRDCTIEVPLIRMTGTFGGGEISMTGAEWAYFREGQNSVVRMIEAQMKIAVAPTNTEGNSDGT
jgi:hypothetical protein